MELIESKSLLAKLMATENLTVEQRPVQTASFDVKNRILTLPILDKNISSDLYDLFTGHEVGHALYTPIEGMLKAKEMKINRDVLNVVEDSRIERKIKYKYPGLKNSFVKAYKELLQKDFFSIQGTDINKMNLIDRINLHCKGGAQLRIRFSEEERFLLDAVETTETYEDVIDVSKKIIEYMKQQLEKEKRQKNKSDEPDELEDSEENEIGDDFEDSEYGDSDDYEDSEEEQESDKDEIDKEKNESDGNSDNEIRSHTDEAFKRNEKQLFDNSINNIIYVNIPDLSVKQINDYKDIWKRYKTEGYEINLNEYIKIRNESNKVVSYLVKEFELRKNAFQMKRATTAKTGELDMKKIYSYNFNEDIFKKISVVPGGKSHGLVMFLDWSGSMVDHIGNTVKQLINLVLFCKKQNIPYEVYSFVEDTDYNMIRCRQQKKSGDLAARSYALMNLLSSRMNSSEFTYACAALVDMTGLGRKRFYFPSWLAMHGTPLNQAIVHAMNIVPDFQKKNKLQIVNTIFLTDGESSVMNRYYADSYLPKYHTDSYDPYGDSVYIKCDRLVIRDPVTKFEQSVDPRVRDSQTNALIRLLKNRTNANVIGFYVIKGRDFNRKVYDWFPKQNNHEEIKENFKKNQFAILENTGYNEYYILRSASLDTDEESTFEVKENATFRGIASAFTKYNNGKHNSRVILNRFIGLIA